MLDYLIHGFGHRSPLIDFRKAFDTIEWDFLIDTQNEFTFGPDVINWVNLLQQRYV